MIYFAKFPAFMHFNGNNEHSYLPDSYILDNKKEGT